MGSPRQVYRFVHTADPADPALPDDFKSDKDAGKTPGRRETAYPELMDGMSTFGSLSKARERWATFKRAAEKRGEQLMLGDFIAEVKLAPDQGFDAEDLKRRDEHLTTWGDPAHLSQAVSRIYPAEVKED